MFRRTLAALLLVGLLFPTVAAAARKQTLIVTINNRKALGKLIDKFGSRIIAQIPGQPIFLIEVNDKKGLAKKIKKEKDIGDVEKDGPVTLTGKKKSTPDSSTSPLGLDQSVMSLFQSVMSLFGDDSLTNFYGTDVREAYAYQPALDVVHASDVRDVTTGAGARIAFIDTGVDPHHPALAPWVEPGVDLLGTGSASEFSGLDQSVMSLFEDAVRVFRSGTLDQSVMSLFWQELQAGTLDQSVMSLFWNQLMSLGLDQSVMSLFWQQLQAGTLDQSVMSLFWEGLMTGTLDQSVMSLFWEELQKLNLDQSVMSLFAEQLRIIYVNQSVMSLFWEEFETLYVNQSVMSLFWEQLQMLGLDQSVMSLFGDGAPLDEFGHGTMVAGLLHATAPEASLVPIRAFDSSGQSTLFLAIAAVYAAIGQDVDVINMSFSIGNDSPTFKRALGLAWSEGIALVASVGNDAKDAKNIYPAAYPIVIGVAATDFDDRLASFSNFGKTVTVTAPGQGVVSTFPGGLWAKASGTSFSAPIVSGSIALLVSMGQRSGTAAMNVVYTSESIDKLNPDFRRKLGRGRINILKALRSRY